MRVCVMGLWHLGTVTAACLASIGHEVIGLDFDGKTISNLRQGLAPVHEPGLQELIRKGLQTGSLNFSSNPQEALNGVEVVWVTYDTPVDDDDRADVQFVMDRITSVLPLLPDGTLVLISSQLPAGSCRLIENAFHKLSNGKSVSFAYSPENLRLGRAIEVFIHPDRVVVGTKAEHDRTIIFSLLGSITNNIIWMSVESAEMTKHALNAFLAVSVAFANEVASLCEAIGADAKEVEKGLKTESRVGPRAYLTPGGAFAGGTLARDVEFLSELGSTFRVPTHLISAVKFSNLHHKEWARRKLEEILGNLAGRRVAVWGLTYKPGTDTLRRSSSVELCLWLASQGALVSAFDPVIQTLPEELRGHFELRESAIDAVRGAAALVIATDWPQYLSCDPALVIKLMDSPVIIDANRFLVKTLGSHPDAHYMAVGQPGRGKQPTQT